jgi:hypothetical protein
MKQNRKNYETNSFQSDINEDLEAEDPFADASGYDPANEPFLGEDDAWDFDDPTMDEELVREIQDQETRDYMDYLAEESDVDEDERAA